MAGMTHVAETTTIPTNIWLSCWAPQDDDADEYPIAMPAAGFTFEEIANLDRAPVSAGDIAAYRQNPATLPIHTSVSSTSDGTEAFTVSSILTRGLNEEKNLLYVVFADEGAEAVAYWMDHFL
ncbi:hypothetical protein DFH09DRAFT_1324368 [Mycena vulgaris]|nr:hypothetical protein DFH09DRAFT_1324368 [Mycena vulgaris]